MADGTNPPVSMLDLLSSYEPGFRLVDMGPLLTFLKAAYSVTTNVAAAGNSRAGATQLTSAINSVLSASGTNFALLLPPALLGKQVIVVNSTSVALSVSPFELNGFVIPSGSSSPALSVPQAVNTTAAYICIAYNPVGGIYYWKQAAPV